MMKKNEDDADLLAKIKNLFSPNFFDLIIVDECHRGSAKKDSNWRKILEYFSSATQIGMTATQKKQRRFLIFIILVSLFIHIL